MWGAFTRRSHELSALCGRSASPTGHCHRLRSLLRSPPSNEMSVRERRFSREIASSKDLYYYWRTCKLLAREVLCVTHKHIPCIRCTPATKLGSYARYLPDTPCTPC